MATQKGGTHLSVWTEAFDFKKVKFSLSFKMFHLHAHNINSAWLACFSLIHLSGGCKGC